MAVTSILAGRRKSVDPRLTFGKKADFYATSEAHTEERGLAAFADLAEVKLGYMVLDMATGTGHAAAALRQRGAEAVGLDLTREMLLAASRLYRTSGLHLV